MPRSIIYIINPISGSKSKEELHELIRKKSRANKITFHIYPSVASGDYSFLLPIIKEEKITDVVIAGGDGTVNQVIGSLQQTRVNFGVLPFGSGNGLAYTAKIPKNPSKALDTIFKGTASLVDGFIVNDQFACMLCGLGFDAQVAQDFARQKKRGLATYVKQVVKNFLTAQPYSFELKIHNKAFIIEAFFISIANSNQFGNNFTIAPAASLTDGLIDVVIVTNQSKFNVLLQTLKQVWGKNKLQADTVENKTKSVIYFQTDRLTIKNLSLAPMHIDGDPAETPEMIKIEVKKKCFSLIQP
jgi:YegS/Rv2252/BmrU family lipid kinase